MNVEYRTGFKILVALDHLLRVCGVFASAATGGKTETIII